MKPQEPLNTIKQNPKEVEKPLSPPQSNPTSEKLAPKDPIPAKQPQVEIDKQKPKKKLPRINFKKFSIKKTALFIKNVIIKTIPEIKSTLIFMGLFSLFILYKTCKHIQNMRLLPKFIKNLILKISNLIDKFATIKDTENAKAEGRMRKFDVFELSLKNMTSKKIRSFVTVGGMAVGIGAITFLVSLGYGLQKLVTDKVARLDELQQTDVSIQPGSNIYLNSEALSKFGDIEGVESALPLIGVAAKINYQGSKSDVAVYGVDTEYLKRSAVSTVEGKLFNTEDADFDPYELIQELEEVEESSESTESAENSGLKTFAGTDEMVQGASDKRSDHYFGEEVGNIRFKIFPGQWIQLREKADKYAKVIGYTRQVEGVQHGQEILGNSYLPTDKGNVVKDENNNGLGKWVRAKVYIWEKKECGDEIGCEEQTYLPKLDENGHKMQVTGYATENEILILGGGFSPEEETKKPILADGGIPTVLGLQSGEEGNDSSYNLEDAKDSSALANLGIDEDDVSWIETILDLSSNSKEDKVRTVAIHPNAQREAVVNMAMVQVLGLEKSNAVGKEIEVSYAVTSNLLENSDKKLESEYATYTIVGVVPEDNIPFFYAPVDDLKSLGVKQYSQVKVISKKPEDLAKVRENVETLGYVTHSVTDTVDQINSLFATSRIALGFVGSIALGVAAFGMFNTLTVSLLERTREVGLMKAMGMTSEEVKSLFLTESLLMGFLGGILGILLGVLAGAGVSLILSILGISKGVGTMDVSYLPIPFAILVFTLSLTVGLGTGIYPAKRATKISALDALRYE